MVSIDNSGNITINRGDTFKVPLFIDINVGDMFESIRLPLKEGDKIIFYLIEPNTSIRNALLYQIYSKEDINKYGDIVLKFAHDDTKFLASGVYYYEIKIQRKLEETGQDAVVTIAPRRKFIVL